MIKNRKKYYLIAEIFGSEALDKYIDRIADNYIYRMEDFEFPSR